MIFKTQFPDPGIDPLILIFGAYIATLKFHSFINQLCTQRVSRYDANYSWMLNALNLLHLLFL